MTEQEIKLKALEIAALILGATDKDPSLYSIAGSKLAEIIKPYLLIAEEVEKHIRQE